MVLDTSAIVASVLKPGYEWIVQRVRGANFVMVSAPTA